MPKRGDTRQGWSTRKKSDVPRGLFKHEGGWGYQFTCGQGHVHRQRVGPLKSDASKGLRAALTKRDAQVTWCPRTERDAQRTAYARSQQATLTIQEYAERWLSTRVPLGCRERTQELYRGNLTRSVFPLVGTLPLTAVTRQKCLEILAVKAKDGLAHNRLRNILIPLRAMLNAAVEDGLLAGNPALRLGRHLRGMGGKDAKTVTALTQDELTTLLAQADATLPDYSDLVHVLALSGVRIGEACGLQWGDLDTASGYLTVQRTVTWVNGKAKLSAPKSGKARRVDVPRALVGRLERRRSLAEAEAVLRGVEPSPWVFPAVDDASQPLDDAYFRNRWTALLRACGLRAIRPDDLRHTYATQLLQAGTPVAYVKDQLGHSSISVTCGFYWHAIPGANRDAVERLAHQTQPKAAIVAGVAVPQRLHGEARLTVEHSGN